MRIARYFTLMTLLTAVITLSTVTSAVAAVDLGNGAWCWFADPRAIDSQGHTYVGAVTTDGSIVVSDVDHAAGTIRTATLYAQLERDDHANPALQLRPDGRLVVYYSRHAGSSLDYQVSARPRDITAWQPARSVPNNIAGRYGFTYPNPVKVAGKTFLFWRGADFSAAYSTQADGTETWTPAQELITGDEAAHRRPYVKYDTDGTTIAVAYTNAHPAEADDVNIYYVAVRDGKLWHADGTLIGPRSAGPIAPSQGDLVQDLPANMWVHDVALDHDGHPVIVYASFPSKTDHRYWYARWTGSVWENHEITPAGGSIQPDTPTVSEPYYSGGITLDHTDPSRVYLSRQVGDGWQVETWKTGDGGATWSSTVLSDSATKNVRPIAPRGGDGSDVLWISGDYQAYWSYGMSVVANWDTPLTVLAPYTGPVAPTPQTPQATPAPPATAPVVVKRTPLRLRLERLRWGRWHLRLRVTCSRACHGTVTVRARHHRWRLAHSNYRRTRAGGDRVSLRLGRRIRSTRAVVVTAREHNGSTVRMRVAVP